MRVCFEDRTGQWDRFARRRWIEFESSRRARKGDRLIDADELAKGSSSLFSNVCRVLSEVVAKCQNSVFFNFDFAPSLSPFLECT